MAPVPTHAAEIRNGAVGTEYPINAAILNAVVGLMLHRAGTPRQFSIRVRQDDDSIFTVSPKRGRP